jgi:hypothetical protein
VQKTVVYPQDHQICCHQNIENTKPLWLCVITWVQKSSSPALKANGSAATKPGTVKNYRRKPEVWYVYTYVRMLFGFVRVCVWKCVHGSVCTRALCACVIVCW